MFTRILTEAETYKIRQYLEDGKRDRYVGVLASYTRKFTPRILQDLTLMDQLLAKYDVEKSRGRQVQSNPFADFAPSEHPDGSKAK